MTRSFPSSFLSRLLLVLVLLLAGGGSLRAEPRVEPPVRPVVVASAPATVGLFGLRFSRGSRAWVVRFAALGMALALFVIIRSTNRS